MALADLSAEELAAFMTAQKSAYNDLKARGLPDGAKVVGQGFVADLH